MVKEIKTPNELQHEWDLLRFLQTSVSELTASQAPDKSTRVNEMILEAKNNIRSYNRREAKKLNEAYFCVSYDGLTVKKDLPDYITSYEEANKFFELNELLTAHESQYDCTGQEFTAWYRFYKRQDGKFILYHRIARDV